MIYQSFIAILRNHFKKIMSLQRIYLSSNNFSFKKICPSAIRLPSHLSAILLQSGSGFSTLVIVETLIFFRCNSVERVHLFSPGVKLICLLRYLFLVSCRGKGMGWGVMWTWKSNLSCFQTVINENKILQFL